MLASSGEIAPHHVRISGLAVTMHPAYRVERTAVGPIAVGFGVKVGLEDGFQHQPGGRLHHPITNGRNAERPLTSAGLRDHHATNRLRPVSLFPKLLTQSRKPP